MRRYVAFCLLSTRTHDARRPLLTRPHRLAERKLKMRQAQSEARKEIDEYRASREAKLRSVQPEVRARHHEHEM